MKKIKRAFTSNSETTISPLDVWFDTNSASSYLGISSKSLLNEVSQGKIPYYKFGKRNRYLKSELDQMLLINLRGPSWE